ncbi:sulfite exporter TauE/SafE family protein [Paenibacillus hemerocallicola]|uniref:Probable membrane transporter protein n=1 Tax=Paenibacillus hemerocallicola TaxID=1172614 RepID=A0A5C4T0Y0_9BACL|nr:sulfite exporter TauE/SafE family protein [Paenibacillus hemerocallicola]TNJ62758.1 sulfite exporter TauE/SafE family protein [Paenibacillus hemerocallicola]
MDLNWTQIVLALLVAVMTGFSKTGVPGAGIFGVALMASIFPAKQSVGMLLPMLITADIVAVSYYRRAAVWKYLIVLIPWVLAGIVIGFFVMDHIGNGQLSVMLGVLILALLLLHLVKDRLERKLNFPFTQTVYFQAAMGILAGFTTMVGNVAGAIMTIYLLSKGLQKQQFIGTGAWFFLAVNLIKVPFNAYLGLITVDTFVFAAWMAVPVLLGTWAGIKIVPRIPQSYFQTLILILTALGAVRLLFL